MTFEGFDAAPVIEGAAFWIGAAMPAETASDQADSLETALRAAGQADQARGSPACGCAARAGRAAARAEAMLIDLWISEPGDTALRPIERPSLAASASWQALVAQAGDELDFGAGMKINALRASYTAPPDPGGYVDENGNGQYDEGEEIVVKGTRPKTMNEGAFWEPNIGDDTGGNQPGGGGPTGSGSTPHKVADHTQDCGTDDGAAVQVAKKVMGVPPGAGPPNPVLAGGSDWTRFEFGAVIVRNADGTYGALNDAIYSNASPSYVHTPDFEGTNAQGIWHNHPDRGNDLQDAIDSYPSVNQGGNSDWEALQQLKDTVGSNDPNFDPSLWITGPDGVTREFKLSERDYYENLTTDQMEAREGLAGKERNQSCG